MIRHLFISLLLILSVSLASAETVIKVDDAVKMAMAQNLSLKSSQVTLNAKKRAADISWSVLIPTVTASSTLMRYNQNSSSTTTNWHMTNGGSLSISLGANIIPDILNTLQAYSTQKITYETAKKSLEKSAIESFYSILLEQENIKLEEQEIARAQDTYDQTLAGYKAGLTSQTDMMTAQVDLESLKPTLENLTTNYINDLGEFKYLLGIPLSTELQLDGNLESKLKQNFDLDVQQWQNNDSNSLASAKASAKTADLNLKTSQASNLLPSLSLSWSKEPYNSDVFNSGGTNPSWTDQGSMSLSLNWTLNGLLPFSTTAETMRTYEDSLKTAQISITEAQITQDLNRSNYLRKVKQAQQSLKALILTQDLAQQTYDLTKEAYRRGTKDLTTLETAEGNFQTAQYNVLSQKYTLITNILDLEEELSLPFGTLTGDVKQ